MKLNVGFDTPHGFSEVSTDSLTFFGSILTK